MDTQKFSEAQEHYNAGDYRKSARLFLDAVEKGTPIGNGPAYHMAGNSFMRLKRYSDAAVVFEHALRDDTYQRKSALEANLANAYVRTGEYDAAIAHYEAALALGDVENTYKLYLGTAQAYMRQQKFEFAAVAYKRAALDEHNPTPGKSLLNLGLAMMAGGNAKGAIDAYKAALASPEYKNKGRALLNMGIAFHSLGMWQDAVSAFEEAKLQPNYQESELAQSTLADAKHRLALESQVAEADHAIEDAVEEDALEAFMEETAAAAFEQASAVDTFADASGAGQTDAFASVPEDDLYPQREVQVGNAEDVERFFAMSEREVNQHGLENLRKERGRFFWLKWLLTIVLLLGALGGGGAALYFTGQGFPSAETTVTDLLNSYSAGNSISHYWTFDSQENLESKMVIIPMPDDFTIDDVERGPTETTVRATIITTAEERFTFRFGLVREGIGWKVNEVALDEAGIQDDFGVPEDDGNVDDGAEPSNDDNDWEEIDFDDFSDYDFDLDYDFGSEEEAPE